MNILIKQLTSSLVLATSLYAGGGYKEVESPVMAIPQETSNSQSTIYAGAGFGMLTQSSDNDSANNNRDSQWDIDTLMFQAGYQYNQYLSFEARYWMGIGDAEYSITGSEDTDLPGDYNAFGFYVKPSYPMGAVDIYGLLGYASVSLGADNGFYWDTNQLSYGIGTAYKISDTFSLFADYVVLGATDEYKHHTSDTVTVQKADIDIDTINFGFNYTF